MNKIVLVAFLVLAINCARPPSPVCRTSPLPSIIPVSIGQTVRLDLQNLFDGYNLQFEGALKDHINISQKFVANHSQFEQSMNFTSAKIKDHERFLGLATHDHYTSLAIGINHPESGVIIQKVIQIEDQPTLHCYDVEEIIDSASSHPFAIIDCAVYKMGEIDRNQFLYVDLTTYKLVLGSKVSDVFVRYNHLISRRIQTMIDPFTHIQYVLRFYTTQGVDTAHSNQTYVQIFMITGSVMQIQILDVIDHTLMGLPSLAILDYQIHFNFIYLLVRDAGLYQIQFTATQRLQRTAFFPIKLNVNRFRVEQNGFNDDLHLVFSNDNTVYQYEWDVFNTPVLVTKYALMAGSVVDEILMDQDIVIVLAWELFNTELQRRVWIFSRRTSSYTNAFGSFKQPSTGPCIIIYRPFERTVHIIYEYRSYNLRINLPYLHVYPVSSQKAGDQQSYLIKATSSMPETGQKIECRQTLNFIYIDNKDTTIFKTGLQGRNETYVDAPDDAEYNLQYEFFGRNISYKINFTVNTTQKQAKIPEAYVEKRVKASMSFPPEINQSQIVYFEMFLENSREQIDDIDEIYGVVQTKQGETSFPIYYINCFVQTDAQFLNPSLRCKIVSKTVLSLGRILHMSQMYDPRQRIAAFIFQAKDYSVYVYYFYSMGFQLYGFLDFGYNYNNIMSSVQITAKRQLIVTYQFGKRLQVYNLDDIHQSQIKPAKPVFTIDTRVMEFFRINYFSPVTTKVSIYHDEVTFIKTKNGVLALNINQMGFPQVLFQIKTTTPKYDFEVNRDTLVIVTQKQMQMYRLTRPLRRSQQPFLLQKFDSDFNLNEYDEINSDGLFYLVQKEDNMLLVVHPNMPSTSVIYTEFFIGNIKMIDAVRIKDKQVLFVFNGKQLLAYMFAENPRLRVRWQPYQVNFTMNISAYNEKSTAEPYSTNFMVIQSNEAQINFTQKFNATAIRKLGHVTTSKNSKKIDLNVTLNDTDWFTGNVMHYFVKCKDCNKNTTSQFNIVLQNHLKELSTQIKVGEPVYDMHSTFTGIYGQLYNAVFKTFSHNDSVQYILNIPTTSRGEVCSKLAVHNAQDYVLSFCQLGGQVNIYITTLNTFKPFTMGPFPTDAEAVNHVEVVGNIIMIVDNDDDPFNRAGGVYLYYLDLAAENQKDMINMLDYLDYADLQIDGFRGIPFIASADIHKPLFNRDQYALFLTEARTGNIFVFLFELSSNKEQAVYLHRRMFELNRLLPAQARHPTPLRVININILDYTVKFQTRMQIQYVLILTVKNWHHVELMMEFDEDYDLLAFQLVRLYERVSYPWELTNFIRLRKGSLNASYMAVNYRDYTRGAQVMVVYQLPYFRINSTEVKEQKLEAGIPITRVLAAYRISDTAEVCFDFNTRDEHRLLFNDVSTNHLSELELNKELKLIITNADPTKVEGQNITIIAENHYMNVTFMVEFLFNFPDDDIGTRIEIIWIIVLIIGFIVVVGLIFVWSRQSKVEARDSIDPNNTQSLLTVDAEFKNNYINRSSADPESVRGTLTYTPPPVQSANKMQKEENPLQEQIESKEQNQSDIKA